MYNRNVVCVYLNSWQFDQIMNQKENKHDIAFGSLVTLEIEG